MRIRLDNNKTNQLINRKMVVLHVKYRDQSQFLYQTNLNQPIDEVTRKIVSIYNGRLKIDRICCEIEELAKHGTLYPPEILGLTDEQVDELKLADPWGDKCVPNGGCVFNKDPIGRRNGKQPRKEMQDILIKACKDAKEMVSKNLVLNDQCLTQKIVQEAINLLKGAVMIVYPMKLPPHDCIRMEFENIEDLSGTQASLDVIDPTTAQLWFCGKEMYRDGRTIGDYIGKIENSKVIVKLTKPGEGAPGREPVLTEEQRKQLMLQAYRRQEELKKLNDDDDDNFLNAEWADNSNLKKSFHGLENITWRPGKK